MSRTRRRWWFIYVALSALVLVGLAFLSKLVLDLERAELCARCEVDHQASLRLGLWRMDSWFGPQLARESSRPFYEYQPYFPQERAYTKLLSEIDPGEVLSPSPLLTFRSDLIRLHFEIDAGGAWSSPQVPTGNHLDLAQETLLAPERLAASRAALAALSARVFRADLLPRIAQAERTLEACLAPPAADGAAGGGEQRDVQVAEQQLLERKELALRAKSQLNAQGAKYADLGERASWMARDAGAIAAGPFVPLWLEAPPGTPELCFVRRVRGGGDELIQGFVAEWERLAEALLAEVRDLFPGARLVPHREESRPHAGSGPLLATIPARLEVAAPLPLAADLASPARMTLLVSWLAALLALGAAGVTLRASIAFGEKRSRFASTVTHELRTPLTTFRMYSEMLAKGMVPEERRREYLETLQRESDRLSGLVENVLAYARLEDGRARLRRESATVAELLARVVPDLRRRADEAGLELHVEEGGAGAVALATDPEAVEQILFNLVDNACKYGRSENGAAIELCATRAADAVHLRVRDRGAGVPGRVARAIFHPFERGERDPSDPNPGVGLGLALARGLARDLGGDLVLEQTDGAGACFRLSLRRAPSGKRGIGAGGSP